MNDANGNWIPDELDDRYLPSFRAGGGCDLGSPGPPSTPPLAPAYGQPEFDSDPEQPGSPVYPPPPGGAAGGPGPTGATGKTGSTGHLGHTGTRGPTGPPFIPVGFSGTITLFGPTTNGSLTFSNGICTAAVNPS